MFLAPLEIKMTILEKCGITKRIINGLIKKGLFVPKKVRPVKKPIRSPSEEQFYRVADRFTPPFTKKEKEFYIKNPNIFCEHLIKNAKFFVKTGELLYDTSEKAQKSLPVKKAIAALLVIQRISHALLDYNYLKYDRHLEYHDYKESPVGYYWQKLKKLCLLAALKTKKPNPKELATQKMLELISGYGIIIKSSKSKKRAQGAYKFLVSSLKNKRLTQELNSLVKIFRQFSLTQEKEVIITYYGLAPRNLGMIEVGFHHFVYLKNLIETHPDLIRSGYKDKVKKWIKNVDFPLVIIGARDFVQVDAEPFIEEIQNLYKEELQRWMPH